MNFGALLQLRSVTRCWAFLVAHRLEQDAKQLSRQTALPVGARVSLPVRAVCLTTEAVQATDVLENANARSVASMNG